LNETGKTEVPCHSRCCTIKIPPCSKALSAEHRPKFCSPSPAMVTTPYKKNGAGRRTVNKQKFKITKKKKKKNREETYIVGNPQPFTDCPSLLSSSHDGQRSRRCPIVMLKTAPMFCTTGQAKNLHYCIFHDFGRLHSNMLATCSRFRTSMLAL
jgi:hypothetical protein